ncbi:MAG: hypothetical protein PHW12_05345, partial [Smithella sp.]|nr:hypothetical protein [Smithella sp.]
RRLGATCAPTAPVKGAPPVEGFGFDLPGRSAAQYFPPTPQAVPLDAANEKSNGGGRQASLRQVGRATRHHPEAELLEDSQHASGPPARRITPALCVRSPREDTGLTRAAFRRGPP